MLDRLLIDHCSATLLGVKAASLVSCLRLPQRQVAADVAAYNHAFNPAGLLFRVYQNSRGPLLLYVYRPALLWKRLQSPPTDSLLLAAGYPLHLGLKACLDRLGVRLQSGEDFPHEVGLFLDYPPDDVVGYLLHGGHNCKTCGYWKVYSDVERARRLFYLYDLCREILYEQTKGGRALTELPLSSFVLS